MVYTIARYRESARMYSYAVSFKIIADPSTMLIAFKSGELDCVTVPSPTGNPSSQAASMRQFSTIPFTCLT